MDRNGSSGAGVVTDAGSSDTTSLDTAGTVSFAVTGHPVELALDHRTTLLDVLRETLG